MPRGRDLARLKEAVTKYEAEEALVSLSLDGLADHLTFDKSAGKVKSRMMSSENITFTLGLERAGRGSVPSNQSRGRGASEAEEGTHRLGGGQLLGDCGLQELCGQQEPRRVLETGPDAGIAV